MLSYNHWKKKILGTRSITEENSIIVMILISRIMVMLRTMMMMTVTMILEIITIRNIVVGMIMFI